MRIGNNVTVKCGVQIWDGITLEDGVMVGSNVTFTKDKFPRSGNKNWSCCARGCAVCLVLASEVYQAEDYIRDYEEFLRFRK